MGSRFIRKVRTASGAIAVQIVEKNGRTVTGIEHLGSAHPDAEFGVLLAKAERELLLGQQAFDLSVVEQLPVRTSDVADWHELEPPAESSTATPRSVTAAGKVIASPAIILWAVLDAAYDRFRFNILTDTAFKAMVLAKADRTDLKSRHHSRPPADLRAAPVAADPVPQPERLH